MGRAVLALIEQMQCHEIGEPARSVEAHVRTEGHRAPRQRHVLVVRAVSCGPTREEQRRFIVFF